MSALTDQLAKDQQMYNSLQGAASQNILGSGGALSEDARNLKQKMQAEQEEVNQENYATSLHDQANQFRQNLGAYTAPQIEAAGENARMNLANDLAGVKSDANARGLLFSGVNAGNQAEAKSTESGKLAGNIQGINQRANATADQLDQSVNNALASNSGQQISFAQLQEQAQESQYSQALQAQQQQQDFFSGLFKGIAGIPATIALAAK